MPLTFTPQSGSTRQDCAYVYDLAGNIVGMTDDSPAAGLAGATGPFTRGFDYDALYRLVYASGREAGSHVSTSDPNFRPTPDTSVGGTVAYYREYSYDKLGNMLDLYHHGGTGNQFHRVFNSTSGSPFELSNLCEDIEYAGTVVSYTFDANGNMLSEGAGRAFEWDFGDRIPLREDAVRWFEEGTTAAAYLYDGGGNRVKKVVRKSSSLKEVTVYIDGGFEYLYTLDGTNAVGDETNEVHVMDGRSRVARVTVEAGQPDEIRYNIEDHLGNAGFTVSGDGSLIIREEYFPFGETSFGSYLIKRYRFCGKERDEESGLYYYGARYYACWACRFVSIDPLAGSMPDSSPFCYAANNPVCLVDVDGLAPGGGGGGGKPPMYSVDANGETQLSESLPDVSIVDFASVGTSKVQVAASEAPSVADVRIPTLEQQAARAENAVHNARTSKMDTAGKIGYWLEQTFKRSDEIGYDPNKPLAKVARFIVHLAYEALRSRFRAIPGSGVLFQIPRGGGVIPKLQGGSTTISPNANNKVSPKTPSFGHDLPDVPELPEKEKREKNSGSATVYWLNGQTQFGHYIVSVKSSSGTTITHQMHLTQLKQTKIVQLSEVELNEKIEKNGLRGEAIFELSRASSARYYQSIIKNRALGPYSLKNNSCLDHVCNVLRAGGVFVPFGPREQVEYMNGKMLR